MDLQPMTTRPCRHSPSLSREGNVLHAFHLQSFCILNFYKRIVRFVPAISLDCTVPRIRQDSCRLMSLCSYRPANPRRIRTDSKHSLRLFDMSFLLVTRLLNSRICFFGLICLPAALLLWPRGIVPLPLSVLPFLY